MNVVPGRANRAVVAVVSIAVVAACFGFAAPGAAPDTLTIKTFKARAIGPAVMGGRVSTIAYDPVDPNKFYIGLGTGGVMRTDNNGATFDAIFEKESVAAVGAIAVAQMSSRQVWVGTGEANDRNSSSWGDGVYHSTDGGGTWTNAGLKSSKTVARIVVDPKDSNTVYVGAMGDLWSHGGDRGLYKTTDAGKSWKRVLGGDGDDAAVAGCGDVVVDPANSQNVYAALYARRRTPWSFESGPRATEGHDLGGIFKSSDGGSTWQRLEGGLPHNTGRIGLDIYRANPAIVYAIVQSDTGGSSSLRDVNSASGGVFRSEDGGLHWKKMNRLDPRPFYFSQIRVDPSNDKRVYVLGFMIHVSDDGGATFQEDFFKNVHADCHELVIDPRNPKRLLLGTDGGPYQSFNSGRAWIHLNTMASGEYYRIAVDMSTPYRIAGGLQDNTNWVGPSKTMSKEGIRNSDWTMIGGGDGFYCVFDPRDSNFVYAESQEGYVHRYDIRSGFTKGLRPEPDEGQPAFRFHWNAPLIPSSHDTGAMYLGGNRVFRLSGNGERWVAISPDLSARNIDRILTAGSGAENYGVVYALAESPVAAGMIWAGTDDGKLWVTRDGGKTWKDVSGSLPKAVRGEWISRIEPGHRNAEVAYLAIDAHRSGNYAPLAYRTEDGGKTWESIAGDLPVQGPVKVVREGLTNPDLLFAGTEFALYITFDLGHHWMKFGDLPTVAVDDIVEHPRENDLVIATHGRSLYIVDDIRPLEDFTTAIADSAAFLFAVRPALGAIPNEGWVESAGIGTYRGANPPDGVQLQYYVKSYTGELVKFLVTNAAGLTVANLTGEGTPGFHKTGWDLRMTKDLLNDYGGQGQKFVKPGEYTVTMTFGKTKQIRKFPVSIVRGIETR